MKAALIFFGVIAFAQARTVPRTLYERIVNGEDAEPGEFPYQVSFQTKFDSFHFCSGAILNENYVVTAAGCVTKTHPNVIKIIAGTTDLRRPQFTYKIDKVIIHEDYDPNTLFSNDIALVKVNTTFVVTPTLNYITLPSQNEEILEYSAAIISGWGWTSESGPSSNVLQKTQSLIVSQKYCAAIHENLDWDIHDYHFCATASINEMGACPGDFGGPLTIDGKFVGIVSGSYECASTVYPTVNIRVSEYIDWIKSNIS